MNDETMYEFIERHPEIRFVHLVWTWDFWAIFEEGGIIWEQIGTEFDFEYCVIAPRDKALEKLANYECWDGKIDDDTLPVYLKDGVLNFRYDAESEFSGGRALYDEDHVDETTADVSVTPLRHVDEPMTSSEECFIRKWNN